MTQTEKTGCICESPGLCPLHKFTTTQREWELCRTEQRYFDAFSKPDSPQKRREAEATGQPLPLPVPAWYPCIHRISDEPTSSIGCTSCGGTKQISIYGCKLFEECSIEPTGDDRVHLCATCDKRAAVEPRRVIIRDNLCPGDITVLTAALRELHEQYPKQFDTDVRVNHPALFDGSPFIAAINDGAAGAESIEAHYDVGEFATVNQSDQRPAHMLEAYCEGLSKALKLPEPLRPEHWLEPSIWLTAEEKGWLSQVQELTGKPPRYWIVNAGTKSDYTAKLWPYYQQVVEQLPHITFVQVGHLEHRHESLAGENVIDLIGKTDLRQIVRLVYHADGILCGVTALAHLAHWVERKPGVMRQAIVISGGREPPHWFSYPGQQVLHTVGQFDCCERGGCWKSRATALPEFPEHNSRLCVHPVNGAPLCMRSISPERVVSLIGQLSSAR